MEDRLHYYRWPLPLRRWLTVVLILGIGTVLGGCSRWQEADVPAQHIAGPPGLRKISSLAQFPNGVIVVGNSTEVWYTPTGQTNWRKLMLPHITSGLGNPYLHLSALPDGRLGMVAGTGLENQRIIYTLAAYDWETQTLMPLLNAPLPDNGLFTWSPTMKRGMFSSAGSFSTLYWITSTVTQPVSITLTQGGKTWFLPDSVAALAEYERSRGRAFLQSHPVGLVHSPSWSPTTDVVVFWATLDTIGKPFTFRSMPWNLYTLDVNTGDVQRILADVYNPTELAWSPDGQWLAYTAYPGDGKPAGLWLFSVATEKLTFVQHGYSNAITWAPDGQSITTLWCADTPCAEPELWVYDVHRLVRANE